LCALGGICGGLTEGDSGAGASGVGAGRRLVVSGGGGVGERAGFGGGQSFCNLCGGGGDTGWTGGGWGRAAKKIEVVRGPYNF